LARYKGRALIERHPIDKARLVDPSVPERGELHALHAFAADDGVEISEKRPRIVLAGLGKLNDVDRPDRRNADALISSRPAVGVRRHNEEAYLHVASPRSNRSCPGCEAHNVSANARSVSCSYGWKSPPPDTLSDDRAYKLGVIVGWELVPRRGIRNGNADVFVGALRNDIPPSTLTPTSSTLPEPTLTQPATPRCTPSSATARSDIRPAAPMTGWWPPTY
jgi:hypothetical protein